MNRPRTAALAFLLFLLVPPVAAAGPAAVIRPDSVQYTWFTGPYTYDGSGNIVLIGPQKSGDQTGKTDYYVYDANGRLKRGTAHAPGYANEQTFVHDRYGNVTRVETVSTPGALSLAKFAVEPLTNQLTKSAACPDATCFVGTYDAAGNQLTSGGGISSRWDPLGMMTTLQAGSRNESYVYDSNNERVLIVRRVASSTDETRVYSMRGSDARVLREVVDMFSNGQHHWNWEKDYVLAGTRIVASIESDAGGERRNHFHLDHLGSTRLLTDDRGFRLAQHVYFPFGVETPGSDSDDERMKFTGHERDLGAGPGQDLDYMHARYYSPSASRFLSPDVVASASAHLPQSWNRYAYTRNSPINFIDPNGLAVVKFVMHMRSEDANRVKGSVEKLGMEETYNGFHLNTNLEIQMEPGDDLNHYTVERDAFINGEFREYGREDPGDPGQIARSDGSMFVFDGPGRELSTQNSGGLSPGVAMRRDNMGEGTFGAIFEVRVVNKNDKSYDAKRHYYYLQFSYRNGHTVGEPQYVELTEDEYRQKLAEASGRNIKKKQKPHRK